MTAKKEQGALHGADFLPEIVKRSLEVMNDLVLATSTASVEASINSARHLVKFQRTGVKTGMGMVSKAQRYTEKSLKDAAKDGKWLPKEGKEVIEEWSKTMKAGIDEFARVTDTSFGLLLSFLDRVEKEQKTKSAAKKPPCAKNSCDAGKPAPAAKKTGSKAKPSPAKKSAVKTKTAAKKKSAPGK